LDEGDARTASSSSQIEELLDASDLKEDISSTFSCPGFCLVSSGFGDFVVATDADFILNLRS
jgi:hypothetical protein